MNRGFVLYRFKVFEGASFGALTIKKSRGVGWRNA